MVQVTYTKMHKDDPDETTWDGHDFKVGEAKEFDGRRKDHKSLIERARLNPAFSVDGEEKPQPKDGAEPSTPEEYRAYAIDWINKAKSYRELSRRWDSEEAQRDELGWGTDDQNLIDPILQPRLEKLKQAEG